MLEGQSVTIENTLETNLVLQTDYKSTIKIYQILNNKSHQQLEETPHLKSTTNRNPLSNPVIDCNLQVELLLSKFSQVFLLNTCFEY